jgi:hypothetical protein
MVVSTAKNVDNERGLENFSFDYRESSLSLSTAGMVSQSETETSMVTAPEKLTNISDAHASETIQEVVKFLDENAGQEVGYSTVFDNVTGNDVAATYGGLGEFLSRPVRIASFTWLEADAVGVSRVFNPWNLFFNDTRIKFKINNYSFIQCNLKVKVIINASPFYYGAMIMSYQPMQSLGAGSYQSITNDAGTRYFIPYSQRPHMWIFPQNNEGGEMTLPFFYNKNWLKIQRAADFTNMGQLTFINYTTLNSANAATGQGVTVQVYAWAENVQISGPSVGLSMQVKTEYDGPVSSVASAIAVAAGAFKKIPIIGEFATTAEMGAKVVRDGAHLLGFTNTPVISDVQPFRPASGPSMATSDVSYPVEKLTLDPRNELSIDPKIAGLNGTDELSICHLVQKESYVTTATWSTTNVTDDILFSSVVTPLMYDNDGATQAKVYMTPMCWLAYNFANWKGDVIFRFRFVASPFHKGRVRIAFDPAGYTALNVINDPASTTAVYNTIVDLGKDSDVELRIPYQQAMPWLYTNLTTPNVANIPFSTSGSPTFSFNDLNHNGTIVIRVLTALTAPVSTAPVSILCFVRGADNMEFANPVNFFSEGIGATMYSYMAPQTLSIMDDEEKETQKLIAGGSINPPAPERYLVNFGESVMSLRQLLRRASLSEVRQIPNTASALVQFKKSMTRWPRSPGFDNSGLDNVKGLITPASNFNFNYTEFHPIAYIMPAFIGTRGSVIWHYNVATIGPIGHIRQFRLPDVNQSIAEVTQAIGTPASTSIFAQTWWQTTRGGTSGHALTNQATQAGLSVELPNYSAYKFQSTSPRNATLAQSSDGSAYDSSQLEIMYSGTLGPSPTAGALWTYCGIGPDFTVLFFLNVPTLWVYSALPTPN